MVKKVFRPFWSYDVSKTEDWLSSMAEKGYYIKNLNRGTRYFFFIKDAPKRITYRIGYNKLHSDSLSRSLLDDGWIKILHSGRWYIISNVYPLEEMRTSPVRESIIKRNSLIMYIYSGFLIYMITMLILFGTIISLITLSQDEPLQASEQVSRSPYWMLTYLYIIAVLALWTLSIYTVAKINKTNKKLISKGIQQSNLHRLDQDEEIRSKDEEKQLKRSGQMIVKRRFGWMYAPDKLEKWLETMEEQGYNLYRMDITGNTFYFIMGLPRKVSYCADFQNIIDESYNDIHRDSGWKSVFISNSSFQKWTLWSHEYSEDEERPQLYSDQSHYLKHARRIAITYSCLFLPLVIVNIVNIRPNIALMFNNNVVDQVRIMNIVSVGVVILTLWFVFIISRIWLYYIRLRRR